MQNFRRQGGAAPLQPPPVGQPPAPPPPNTSRKRSVSSLCVAVEPTKLKIFLSLCGILCFYVPYLCGTHWLCMTSTLSCMKYEKRDYVILRVRAFFHKTVRVCHVYCNFKIGFTCRITLIFGTLKDGSLLINTLASNICFSYRNMFQNGVDALSKIVDAFLSKSSKFHLVRIIR